jgi:hypothetical protein
LFINAASLAALAREAIRVARGAEVALPPIAVFQLDRLGNHRLVFPAAFPGIGIKTRATDGFLLFVLPLALFRMTVAINANHVIPASCNPSRFRFELFRYLVRAFVDAARGKEESE